MNAAAIRSYVWQLGYRSPALEPPETSPAEATRAVARGRLPR
jgi:hypothetical protein